MTRFFLEKSRDPVPSLHIDDRLMLAFVEYAFMNDFADIDRAAEQMVERAPGEYSASELPAGDRCPDFTANLGVFEAVVEDGYILCLYI